MSGTDIVIASGIVKRFGGFTALNGVDFTLTRGERLGLIGPNGSGKSTFVNCLTGALPFEGGSVSYEGQDISKLPAWQRARMGITRSFQIPRPFRGLNVRQNIEVPLAFTAGMSDQDRIEDEADRVLDQVGLLAKATANPRSLSQVELRKLELGRALAGKPRVLIADEAMAGLSDSEVDEILELLMKLNGAGISIILIEHIMRAVVRFSERVVVLVAGEKIADGEPREVMSHPEVVRAYLGQ
jgi:branched-chain amino acid transport system ATP-binding protein